MENYKLASQLKLKFTTVKGLLSVEQLWDLSLSDLDDLAVKLEKEHEESGVKSYLTKKSDKNKLVKLRFDIVLDILNTKVDDQERLTNEKETKKHNEKILTLIAEKQEGELKNKSVDELMKLLK